MAIKVENEKPNNDSLKKMSATVPSFVDKDFDDMDIGELYIRETLVNGRKDFF